MNNAVHQQSHDTQQGGSLLHLIDGDDLKACGYTLRTFRWSGPTILDACTVDAVNGQFLILSANGSLHLLDLHDHTSTQLCAVDFPEIPPFEDHGHFGVPKYRLHASRDGAYAAIVVDRGRNGKVLETRSGATTMHLDGGNYCVETVPYSACFLRFDGRDAFVHRSDWNRLDVSDPRTGKCLTERYIAPYEAGGNRPNHYLDYFHGQLLPSPEGSLLFDDGWVWHPVSIPRVWSVAAWLVSNPWESEDGASIVDLGMREDWNQPACWIDEKRIAIWSAAEGDQVAFEVVNRGPGVGIYDVTESKTMTEAWWPMPNREDVIALFSDGMRLYTATPTGTTAWDIGTRELLGDYPGIVARLLDRRRNVLLAFDGAEIQEVVVQW